MCKARNETPQLTSIGEIFSEKKKGFGHPTAQCVLETNYDF